MREHRCGRPDQQLGPISEADDHFDGWLPCRWPPHAPRPLCQLHPRAGVPAREDGGQRVRVEPLGRRRRGLMAEDHRHVGVTLAGRPGERQRELVAPSGCGRQRRALRRRAFALDHEQRAAVIARQPAVRRWPGREVRSIAGTLRRQPIMIAGDDCGVRCERDRLAEALDGVRRRAVARLDEHHMPGARLGQRIRQRPLDDRRRCDGPRGECRLCRGGPLRVAVDPDRDRAYLSVGRSEQRRRGEPVNARPACKRRLDGLQVTLPRPRFPRRGQTAERRPQSPRRRSDAHRMDASGLHWGALVPPREGCDMVGLGPTVPTD